MIDICTHSYCCTYADDSPVLNAPKFIVKVSMRSLLRPIKAFVARAAREPLRFDGRCRVANQSLNDISTGVLFIIVGQSLSSVAFSPATSVCKNERPSGDQQRDYSRRTHLAAARHRT